jgi:hypothetical protein
MASAGRGQETAEELWAGEGLGMADIGAGVPLLVVSAAAFALNAGVLEVAIRTRLVAAPGRDSILDGPPCETLPSAPRPVASGVRHM